MAWQRPLTGVEHWQWLFDRAAVLNLVLLARLSGRFDHDRLRDALDAVGRYYPHLTARVEGRRHPRFVGGAAPIELSIAPWQEGEWRDVAVAEANKQLPGHSGPLMRVVLLDGADTSDLILNFNHVVADGQSGALITREVLRAYAGGALPATASPSVLDPPLRRVFSSRLRAAAIAVRLMSRMRGMMPITPERRVPAKERRTGLIDVRMPAADFRSLAGEARRHGATVHGALVAAMVLAIEEELRATDGAAARTLGCITPIDMRRHGGLSPEAVGNLLSGVVTAHQVDATTDLWEVAAAVSKTIRSAIRNRDIFALARLQDMTAGPVRDLDKMVAKTERFSPMAGIATNLGRLDFGPVYGDLKLERLGFLVSSNANAAAALVLCATTVAGTTCLNFAHAEPLLSAERCGRLVDGTVARLRAAMP